VRGRFFRDLHRLTVQDQQKIARGAKNDLSVQSLSSHRVLGFEQRMDARDEGKFAKIGTLKAT